MSAELKAILAQKEAEVERIKKLIDPNYIPNTGNPVFQSIAMQLFNGLAKKSLSTEDLIFLEKHKSEGCPGIIPFVDSETIISIFQLGFSEYKEFLAGKQK